MQVYPDKFQAHLKRSLDPVYCIAGDDILLRDEIVATIRTRAKGDGFSEIERHHQDKEFSWDNWLASGQAMSLFAESKIVELHLSSGKIGTEGSAAIVDYIAQQSTDTILIIVAPAVSGKPKWIKTIIDGGTFVHVYPLEGQALESWLVARAKLKGLVLDRESSRLLADRVEGNLVSAEQELEKLSLLLPEGTAVSPAHIDEWVADNARFNVFKMLDLALQSNATASCRALRHLREEGTLVPAIVPVVANRLALIKALEFKQRTGQLEQAFQAERVIQRSRAMYARALQRLPQSAIANCVQLCAHADRLSKSGESELPWILLETLLCELAGIKPGHTDQLVALERQAH